MLRSLMLASLVLLTSCGSTARSLWRDWGNADLTGRAAPPLEGGVWLLPPDDEGYALEAPYAELGPTIRNRLDARLVEPFASLAKADLWLFGHVLPRHPDGIRPVDHVADVSPGVPLLLISGDADRKAPLDAVRRMAATRGGTELLVLRGARHDGAFRTHHAEYARAMDALFARVAGVAH